MGVGHDHGEGDTRSAVTQLGDAGSGVGDAQACDRQPWRHFPDCRRQGGRDVTSREHEHGRRLGGQDFVQCAVDIFAVGGHGHLRHGLETFGGQCVQAHLQQLFAETVVQVSNGQVAQVHGHQVVNQAHDFVVVARPYMEDVFDGRLAQAGRAGQRAQVDHVAGFDQGRDGRVVGRAHATHQGHHLAAGQHLPDVLDTALGLVGVVGQGEVQRATVDAALFVDLGERRVHTLLNSLSKACERPGQGCRTAHDQGIGRRCARRESEARTEKGGQGEHRGAGKKMSALHGWVTDQ